MYEVGNWINGQNEASSSSRTSDIYNPATGEIQGKVKLSTAAELDAAVAKAAEAQKAWAATNPQRRARVMMKFAELINRDMDKLAESVSREHGKTLPDGAGDVQRGLEVIEVCMGAPNLLKGEFMDSGGPGIDLYSMRQPLGVVAGITPFNFPAMIPLWKMGPALVSGNAMILKPSERCPTTSMMLAELLKGSRASRWRASGRERRQGSGGRDPRQRDHSGGGLRGFHPDRAIHLRSRRHQRQARPVLRRRQEPHDYHARRGPRQSRRRAGGCRFRRGRRTLHGDLGRGSGRQGHRRQADRKAHPKVEALKVGPYTSDKDVDYGPVITAQAKQRIESLIDSGVNDGATLVTDGRDFSLQGYEDGFYVGPTLFDNVTEDMDIYKEEIFGPVLSTVRKDSYEEALDLVMKNQYGNGTAIFTSDGDTARDFASRVNVGMVGINFPIPVPLSYFTFGGWKKSAFGDLNQYGPDAFRFYTRTKTVTERWFSGIKEGGEFAFKAMD